MNAHSSYKSARTPRRTLNRLAAAFLALGIGALAQAAFNRGSVWDGALLYVAAIVVFALSVGLDKRKRSAFPPYRGLFASLGLSAGRRLQMGIWSLAAAVAASFAGWLLFDDADWLTAAWQLYGFSLLVFTVGAMLLTSRGARVQGCRGVISPLLLRTPAPLLIGILLLALALRLWNLGDLPFGVWYDEAEAGLQARRWLTEPDYNPAFYTPISVSGQLLFLYSLALRFISDSVLGLRVVSALFGVGGALAAYLFGRELVRGSGGAGERGSNLPISLSPPPSRLLRRRDALGHQL